MLEKKSFKSLRSFATVLDLATGADFLLGSEIDVDVLSVLQLVVRLTINKKIIIFFMGFNFLNWQYFVTFRQI